MIEHNGKTLETNFGELGCPCRFIKGVSSPLGDTYYFDLISISNYNKAYLKSLIEKIAVFHHKDLSFVETKESHFAVFMKHNQTKLSLSQIISNHALNIGVDINGNKVAIDFNKAPHLLIAGTTGSGKSVLIHNLLTNIMYSYKKPFQFVLIDPKGTELVMYRNVKNTTFVSETQKAINVLAQLENIMDNRYRNGTYHHEIFIVIDELADLMLTSRFEVEQSIVRIAQKGRACGLHLIVATQSPRATVISGLIKANMPYRLILKTTSVRESVVALDHKGSEELQGCGDCIVKLGLDEKRTQIAYCDNELESRLIQSYGG